MSQERGATLSLPSGGPAAGSHPEAFLVADPQLALLLAIVAGGAYVQAVTGFAFGLVVLGAVALLDLAPLAVMAAVVSVGTFFNTGLALRGCTRRVCWRDAGPMLAGMLPAVFAGIALLECLDAGMVATLHAVLACAIIGGGAMLALAPRPRAVRAGGWQTLAMGAAGGLFTGLLAAGGPPVVYHLYRQPYPVATVRATLLATFAIACVARLGLLALRGGLGPEVIAIALPSIPVVMAATVIGRRFPPPLSDAWLRRLAFGLLAVLGVLLLAARALP